ncbi:hypothetical protein J6590_073828 [Homalodisca vitripennis]|nr:hypothetical protein J6590_073828 [Homalodisca vitripennis]
MAEVTGGVSELHDKAAGEAADMREETVGSPSGRGVEEGDDSVLVVTGKQYLLCRGTDPGAVSLSYQGLQAGLKALVLEPRRSSNSERWNVLTVMGLSWLACIEREFTIATPTTTTTTTTTTTAIATYVTYSYNDVTSSYMIRGGEMHRCLCGSQYQYSFHE